MSGEPQAGRSTARDVAREAGVGTATVDRVLNSRGGVSAGTVARVEQAILRLGYRRDLAAANLARGRIYRLLFILPGGDHNFMRQLERDIRRLAGHPDAARTQLALQTVPAFDGAALAERLEAVDVTATDGVAVVATDATEVRAGINRLSEAGVHVVTLISDLPTARRHFVGIDNIAAGRSAGALLGRLVGERGGSAGPVGPVGIVVGSRLVRDHVERRIGFEQIMRQRFGHLRVLDPVEGLDDPEVAEARVSRLLAAEPELVGLYSAGAGNRGVIAALELSGRSGRIVTVAHELTPPSRRALDNGIFDVVIHQDTGHEARSALRVLRALCDASPVDWAQERIRIEIFIRENLP